MEASLNTNNNNNNTEGPHVAGERELADAAVGMGASISPTQPPPQPYRRDDELPHGADDDDANCEVTLDSQQQQQPDIPSAHSSGPNQPPPDSGAAMDGSRTVESKDKVCRHDLAGRCTWGASCRFAHRSRDANVAAVTVRVGAAPTPNVIVGSSPAVLNEPFFGATVNTTFPKRPVADNASTSINNTTAMGRSSSSSQQSPMPPVQWNSHHSVHQPPHQQQPHPSQHHDFPLASQPASGFMSAFSSLPATPVHHHHTHLQHTQATASQQLPATAYSSSAALSAQSFNSRHASHRTAMVASSSYPPSRGGRGSPTTFADVPTAYSASQFDTFE
jgi:hypothetical protein